MINCEHSMIEVIGIHKDHDDETTPLYLCL